MIALKSASTALGGRDQKPDFTQAMCRHSPTDCPSIPSCPPSPSAKPRPPLAPPHPRDLGPPQQLPGQNSRRDRDPWGGGIWVLRRGMRGTSHCRAGEGAWRRGRSSDGGGPPFPGAAPVAGSLARARTPPGARRARGGRQGRRGGRQSRPMRLRGGEPRTGRGCMAPLGGTRKWDRRILPLPAPGRGGGRWGRTWGSLSRGDRSGPSTPCPIRARARRWRARWRHCCELHRRRGL